MSEEITKDRYVNRRKMAWRSFHLVVIVGIPIAIFGLLNNENAARVGTMNIFLGSLFGVWIAVILAYFGATTMTDRKEIETGNNMSASETTTEIEENDK